MFLFLRESKLLLVLFGNFFFRFLMTTLIADSSHSEGLMSALAYQFVTDDHFVMRRCVLHLIWMCDENGFECKHIEKIKF